VTIDSDLMSNHKVGIVVPSLGHNFDYLGRAVRSVLNQQERPYLLLVFPRGHTELENFCKENDLPYIFDSGNGFMSAFNLAIEHLKALGIEIFGSIGDDDELLQGCIASLSPAFQNPKVVAAFGHCWYINSSGKTIFHNKSRTWLLPVMNFLPDILPAPGALIRLSAWETLNGFSTEYKFASDYDFWLRLRKVGIIARVEAPMSLFRWHAGGLTGKNRAAARQETKRIRRSQTGCFLWPILFFIEYLTIHLGEFALKRSMKKDYSV
jgi:GT2 family glycosyltransferase